MGCMSYVSFGKKQGTLALASAALLVFTQAWGAGPADNVPLGPGVDTTLPPSFNSAQAQQLANIFTSCMGPQVNAGLQSLGNLAQGQPGMGAVSISTVCPEAASLDAPNSCDLFMIDGVFSLESLQNYGNRNKQAMDSLMCKKGKFAAAQGELQCLMNQANILSQQIGAVQQAYLNNIQRMQQDVQQLKSIEEDRKQQGEEVQARLGGRQGTGETGLLELKQRFEQVFQGMPQEIQGARESYIGLANQRRSLEEQLQARTMSLTSQCFRDYRQVGFTCSLNGPSVTAIEYVLCRYQQMAQTGEGGVIEQNSGIQRQATSGRANLEALLNQILADAPANAKIPLVTGNAQADQQAMAQMIDQPINILTAADIESRYGDQLSQFNQNGLDIREFVLGIMGNCFNRSTRQVAKERKRANTGVGQAQEALKRAERTTSDTVNALLNKYQSSYSEAMRSLTGINLPMNVGACRGATPSTQVNCLTEIQAQMEGMLDGSTANSTIDMMIRGNRPETNIVFSCQGLNGCIRKLQNAGRQLQAEQTRVKAYRTQYVNAANQNIHKFTQQIAQYLSPQSQQLTARLAQLNTALASMGVSTAINLNPLEAEQLQPDPNHDGLYGPPQSVLKLVGGNMNPPMLDVSGNAFGNSLSGVADGSRDLDRDIARVADNNAKLASLQSSCRLRPVKELSNSMAADVRDLGSCPSSASLCGANGTLSSLVGAVSSLTPGGGLDQPTIDNLSTGIAGVCSPAGGSTAEPTPNTPGVTGQINYYPAQRCDMVARQLAAKVERVRGVVGNGSAGSAF